MSFKNGHHCFYCPSPKLNITKGPSPSTWISKGWQCPGDTAQQREGANTALTHAAVGTCRRVFCQGHAMGFPEQIGSSRLVSGMKEEVEYKG